MHFVEEQQARKATALAAAEAGRILWPVVSHTQSNQSQVGVAFEDFPITDEEYPKLIAAAKEIGVERVKQIEKERWPEYERIIEYEGKQLREEILPSYREWLACSFRKCT